MPDKIEKKEIEEEYVSSEVVKTKPSKEPIKTKLKRKSSEHSNWAKQHQDELILFQHTVVAFCTFHIFNTISYYYYVSKDSVQATGLDHLLNGLTQTFKLPEFFNCEYIEHIRFDALKAGTFFAVAVTVIYIIWFYYKKATKRNRRVGEEYGSAKKGDIWKEAAPLNAKNNPDTSKRSEFNNTILSQNIQVDMDTRHTMLNNNVFVVGGSGAGKTRFFVKPNCLQMACNYIIIDPKGSVAEEIGHAFEKEKYEIRYLNLVNMEKSMRYNPFEYFNEPLDVQKFVNNLVENTKDANSVGGDDFFVKSEITWMCAIIFYIMATCKGTDRCNMNTLMLMLDHSKAYEDDSDEKMSEVDFMFTELEHQMSLKNHGRSEYGYDDLAVRNYKIFKMGAGKTAKSILISVGVRLSIFNQPALRNLLSKDELHLEHLGTPMVKSIKYPDDLEHDISRDKYEIIIKKKKENNKNCDDPEYENLSKDRLRKVVLFVITNDHEKTFAFLSSIILEQIYTQLYAAADERHDKKLPIHTRIINDEFANTGKQPDYARKISTMRSREISTCVIVQGISQIKSKSLYGDDWEAIFENCDMTLFLGSKGPSTLEQMTKLAGKETDVVETTSVQYGVNRTVTKNENLIARDQYDYSELGRLDISLCLVHIKGHQVYEDKKYDVKQHPNAYLTMDTKGSKKDQAANRFDIEAYDDTAQKIEIARSKNVIQDLKDEHIDVDQLEGLLDGEILESGNVFDLPDAYFDFDEDMLSAIEAEMEKEGDADLSMKFLPI